MARPSVVFLGSGPVAAEALRLLSDHCDIEAIITKPTTKVELQAAAPDAPLHCVSTKQELDELFGRESFASHLGVLIDFGIIVSQEAIDYFPKGIINSHFSLLPEWRGADPISFALLSGQAETGVSLMLLSQGMDEGLILSLGKLTIAGQNNPLLTKELIELSDQLLKQTIPAYLEESIEAKSQQDVAEAIGIDPKPTYSRKLTKSDGLIDWAKPAEQIEREIRAYYSWPRSRTQLGGKDVIITDASATDQRLAEGEVVATKDSLVIGCGQGALSIQSLQPAGKKEMPIRAFLAGNKL